MLKKNSKHKININKYQYICRSLYNKFYYFSMFEKCTILLIVITLYFSSVLARNNYKENNYNKTNPISSLVIKTTNEQLNSIGLELVNDSGKYQTPIISSRKLPLSNNNSISIRKDRLLETLLLPSKHQQSYYNRQYAISSLSSSSSSTLKLSIDQKSCRSNCSGHGDCFNGTCFCEVEYSGGTCNHPNFKYYISFSTVYYMICVVCFIQLMLCINSEIARQKPRSISKAFRINIQKALYFFICIATAIRGFYFSSPTNGQLAWTESLISAYYPILMSGSSLLVCFWAEVCNFLKFYL